MHAANFLAALEELTPVAAERWVAAALAEASALREHDDRLYPPAGDTPALEAARHLHDAWRRWADDAEMLLGRLHPLRGGDRDVPRAGELDHAIGRARAMLKLTPQQVHERRRQAREGHTFSAEEVRRELGLPPRR